MIWVIGYLVVMVLVLLWWARLPRWSSDGRAHAWASSQLLGD